MKYKLIKTTVNVKTHIMQQSIEICNGEKELEEYWKKYSNVSCVTMADKVGDTSYLILAGQIKDSDCIITIAQYSLNYLP